MAPFARKGRNPGPVDEWLDALGYYRKNVAYDETCLFRAASEQLFSSQLFHQKIRKECISYARQHHSEFAQFVPCREDWELRLDRLEKHMAICGRAEMHMISRLYNKGIVLFDGITLTIKELTGKQYKENLFLCHMGEDHFDAVYYKSYIQDAGFCQSIVYNIVYENVFHIPKVASIVEKMLYHKPLTANGKSPGEECKKDALAGSKPIQSGDAYFAFGLDVRDESLNDYEFMLKTNLAPFPFKVAKALDPTIYRNIEYDTWTELRKEMRLGDWYYGDGNLIEGSGCILHERGGDEQHCYIQEIVKHDDTAVVYVTKKGERRRVRLADLRPEQDAKPWPLPYRFSKHLVISVPKLELTEKKGLRKRREKKRTTSSASEGATVEISELPPGAALTPFEGAPLQMQADQAQSANCEDDLPEGIPAQQMQVYDGRWPQRQEAAMWPAAYGYGGVQEPVYFQQGVQPSPTYYANEYHPHHQQQQQYIWPNGEYLPPPQMASQTGAPSPQSSELPVTPDCFNFFFSDGSSYSSSYYAGSQTYQLTPTSPQVEVYAQPVYQPAVHTPVILGDVLPTPPPPPPHVAMYTSPIEMPCAYFPQSPFVFPPTPTQPAWYQPPPVNAQGFIFPTINLAPPSPAPAAP